MPWKLSPEAQGRSDLRQSVGLFSFPPRHLFQVSLPVWLVDPGGRALCIPGHCSGNKGVSAQASAAGLLHAGFERAWQVLIEMIGAVGFPPFLGGLCHSLLSVLPWYLIPL